MDNGGASTARMLEEAGIGPGMRVLDVGCGPGDVSLRLAAIVGPGGQVTGLDRDDASLVRARERARAEGVGNVEFVSGDLDATILPPGSFDAVVGRRVLMYLPDPRRSLRALGGVLRPGGVIAFQEHDSARVGPDPLPRLHARIHGQIWRTIAHEGGNLHMGLGLAAALRDAGFAIEGIRVEATMLIPEQDNLVSRLATMMIPRMVAAGVATANEHDADQLERQLADERAASDAPLSWETIFAVWARAKQDGPARFTSVRD